MGLSNSVPENIFSQEPINQVPSNSEQVEFENLLKICVLIDNFGTYGLFGSAKSKKINLELLSRGQLEKYIRSTIIPEELIDQIEQQMPGKLIKLLEIPFIMPTELEKKFIQTPEYFDPYAEELIQFYKNLNIDTDIDNDIDIIEIVRKINFDQKELKLIFELFGGITENTIKQILKNLYPIFELNVSHLDISTLEEKINYLFTEKTYRFSIKDYIKTNFTDENICRQVLKIAIDNLTIDKLKSDFNPFVLNYRWTTNKKADGQKIVISKEITNISEKNKFKYYSEIYINDPENKSEPKYKYYLNFLDYWELYKLNPAIIKQLIEYNFLVDDYTFAEYKHNDWSFLDCLNPDVKQNIITKHNSDKVRNIHNRYGEIRTLEDLVDIIIFCQNPPNFLRSDDTSTKYYEEYSEILDGFLKSIGWNMNKLDYLNWNLEYKLSRVA